MDVVLADWVFGYGSLIWDPEVDFEEEALARVHGYHRAFCIRSTLYRGTPERPGVVLGLDRGGSCVGVAYRLRHATRRDSIARLYEREMRNRIYQATLVPVTLCSGRQVRALTFVANREHEGYEQLPECELLARLSGCCGARGANRDYLINTWRSLEARGVHDARLARLGRMLLAMPHGPGDGHAPLPQAA